MSSRLPLFLAVFGLCLEVSMPVARAEDLPAWTPDANAARADIPDIYTWDLTRLFAGDAAWAERAAALPAEIHELDAYKGRLAGGPTLLACLDRYVALHSEVNRLTLYANLQAAADQTDETVEARNQQALAVLDELQAAAGFIRAEVLGMDDKQMAKAYKKAPTLKEKHGTYIEGLRRRKHTMLSPDAEYVLSLAGDNLFAEIDLNEIPAPIEDAFSALLVDIPWPTIHDGEGKEVQLTLSNYGRYRRDPDRRVRAEAVAAMMGTLRQYQHVLAATLSGQAEFNVFLARSRGYDTAMQAYLDKDDIDPAVYENLVHTVGAHLEPLHRYISLRKEAMGVDKVHLYDMYVPIVGGVEQEVSFQQARATILEALQPLGPDYIGVLEKGLDPEQGWLDLYPSREKQSGAFSASTWGLDPYVLMNYQDAFDDMSTLAHEYGHAMHSYLSMTHQSYSDYRYVPFLAEIASTANESLLADHLLAQATDDRVRASLLNARLDSIRGTIYRQALFAEFEWKLHTFVEDGTPITATLLEQTYADLVTRYYGPDYAMDANDEMEWAYIPHFYWKYYVFTYATGLSSGIAISQLVRQGPEQRDAYLGMLQAGCSAPPMEILAGAGVDLTTPAPIEAALKLFDETVSELEALLPKLQAEEAPAPAE
ncbi:MAG: oligoendopeptidase F [Pseudomonadota bacterium]